MRTIIKKLGAVALLSFAGIYADSEVTPTLILRSQGRHADRQKLVGMARHTHQLDQDGNYGVADIAVGYSRSFREDRLAACLFGNDLDCSCDPTIKVQGSNVVTAGKVDERDPKAWLADYLYLNCDFDGEFSIKPRIQNVTVDLDLYLGLNDILEGLYGRIYGPITWTKWQTNFCSNSDTDVTTSCQFGGIGYFTSDGSEVFLSKLSDYFIGKAPAPAGFNASNIAGVTNTTGVTFQPLKYAKMGADCDVCDDTQTGFADLRAELGYEWFREEDYHLGINIQAAAPTGNRHRAEFVMQPIVGNGNHWELGGGLDFHYTFWRGQEEDRSLSFHLDANLTHLFSAREQRTFDLVSKPNSRYMLAAKMRPTNSNSEIDGASTSALNLPGFGVDANFQFDNEYAPVANLTTLDVRVDVGLQADIAAMFSCACGGFNLDFGYNFWGRTCEDIKCVNICDPCDQSLCSLNGEQKWVLKGDAHMFGYEFSNDNIANLSASQSKATIHSGTNALVDTDACDLPDGTIGGNARLQNCGVDNPLFAYRTVGAGRLIYRPENLGGTNTAQEHIKSSFQPILLECNDIDFKQTRGISHTLFGHLSYTWEDKDDYVPFIGIGGSAEFGHADKCCDTKIDCCPDECKNCVDCALSQWTVWLKGGVSFN